MPTSLIRHLGVFSRVTRCTVKYFKKFSSILTGLQAYITQIPKRDNQEYNRIYHGLTIRADLYHELQKYRKINEL